MKHKLKVIRNELLLDGPPTRMEMDGSDESYLGNVTGDSRHWNYGKNLSFTDDDEYNKKLEQRNNEWRLLREQNPPGIETEIHVKTSGFFCEAPSKFEVLPETKLFFSKIKTFLYACLDIEYAHFVVQRVNYNLTETLFELNALLGKTNILPPPVQF